MITIKNLGWIFLSLIFVILGGCFYVFELTSKFCRKAAWGCIDRVNV